jgi:hypothetical protein
MARRVPAAHPGPWDRRERGTTAGAWVAGTRPAMTLQSSGRAIGGNLTSTATPRQCHAVQWGNHAPTFASMLSQIAFSICTPSNRAISCKPVGEVTLISVR